MKRRRFLLFACRFVMLPTLLTWVWLLYHHPDPTLVGIPSGVSFLGLSLYQAFRLEAGRERWETLHQTFRLGCCFSLIWGIINLVSLAAFIGDGASTSSPPNPIVQGSLVFLSWFQAAFLVLGMVLKWGIISSTLERCSTMDEHP